MTTSDTSFNFPGPHYDLADHPDIAAALGRLTAAWSLVEIQLTACFAVLLGAPPWKSHVAYLSVANNSARVDMIRSLIPEMKGSPIDQAELISILENIRSVRIKRNGYVHKLWLRDGKDVYAAEGLAKDWPEGKRRKVHAAEIIAVADQIVTAAERMARFFFEYSGRNPLMVHAMEITPSSARKLSKQRLRPH